MFKQTKLLAVVGICFVAALGCTRETHIEIPQDFHGHVVIHCGDVIEDRNTTIHVSASGTLDNVRCPERQGHLLISGTDGKPVEGHEVWTTTGDGIVRGISFDIP